MKLLFVMPSFHTNIVHAMAALVARGAQPTLLLRAAGAGRVDGVATEIVAGDPGIAEAGATLRRLAPDLVVVRKTAGLSRPFALAALAGRRPLLAYDQRPCLRPRPFHAVLSRPLAGRPAHRITPVRGLVGAAARVDRLATYTPFPVAPPGAALPQRVWAPDGTVRILCVGKLAEARKEHERLIRAMERIAGRLSFTLTLVGSASLGIGHPDAALVERLRAYPATGAIGSRVSVRTDVAFADMDALYAAHDLCVLPSRREPLGTAPVEAMARGCAALISDECGSAGYVEEAAAVGATVGRVFRAGDDAALEAALLSLADPAALERHGRAAAAWCRTALGAERFVATFASAAAARGADVAALRAA